MEEIRTVAFTLNGEQCTVPVTNPSLLLLEYLHSRNLYGTKYGCGEGGCGSCTLLIRNRNADEQFRAINACLRPLAACNDLDIMTVDGLSKAAENGLAVDQNVMLPTSSVDAQPDGKTLGAANKIAYAIAKCGGTQCGYCTPGFTMTLCEAQLRNDACTGTAGSSDIIVTDIEDLFSGNICRCTGYRGLRLAAKEVLQEVKPDPNLIPPNVIDVEQKRYGDYTLHSDNVEVVELDAGQAQKKQAPVPPAPTPVPAAAAATNATKMVTLDRVSNACAESAPGANKPAACHTPYHALGAGAPAKTEAHDTPHFNSAALPAVAAVARKSRSASTTDKRTWYSVRDIKEVQARIDESVHRGVAYKLVYGNTSAGIYKDTEWTDIQVFIDMNSLEHLNSTAAAAIEPVILQSAASVHTPHQQQSFLHIPAACTINSLRRFLSTPAAKGYFETDALMTMLNRVAGNQVRNVGTVGGSIAMAVRRNFLSDTFLALVTADASASVHVRSRSKTHWKAVFAMPLMDRSGVQGVLNLQGKDFILESIRVPLHRKQKDHLHPFMRCYKVSRRLQNSHSLINLGGRVVVAEGAHGAFHAQLTVGNIAKTYLQLEQTEHSMNAQTKALTALHAREQPPPKSKTFKDQCLEAIKKIEQECEQELQKNIVVNDEFDSFASRIALALNILRRFLLDFYSTLFPLQPLSDAESLTCNMHNRATNPLLPHEVGEQGYRVDNTEFPISEPMIKTTAVQQASGTTEYTRTMTLPENCLHATFVLSAFPTGALRWKQSKLDTLSETLSKCAMQELSLHIPPAEIKFFRAKDLGLGNMLSAPGGFESFKEYLLADAEVVYCGQAIGIICSPSQEATEYFQGLLNSWQVRAPADATVPAARNAIVEYGFTYEPVLTLDNLDTTIPVRSPLTPGTVQQVARKFNTYNAKYKSSAAINWISNLPGHSEVLDFTPYTSDPSKYVVVQGQHEVGSQYHFAMETQCAVAQAPTYAPPAPPPPTVLHSTSVAVHVSGEAIDQEFAHAAAFHDGVAEQAHDDLDARDDHLGAIGSRFSLGAQEITRTLVNVAEVVHNLSAVRRANGVRNLPIHLQQLVDHPISRLVSLAGLNSGKTGQSLSTAAINVRSAVESALPTASRDAAGVVKVPYQTMHVTASTQSTASISSNISTMLSIVNRNRPDQQYQVITHVTNLGGGFGGKEPQSRYVALGAAFVADRMHRPCRIALDRTTDMRMIGKRHPFRGTYTVAAEIATGKLVAMDMHYMSDGGINYDCSLPVMDLAVLSSFNAYNIPQFVCHGDTYFTNKATGTAMRSFGVVQANQITEAAVEMALDAVRQRNPALSVEAARRGNFFAWMPAELPDTMMPVTPFGQPLRSCNSEGVWSSLSRRILQRETRMTDAQAVAKVKTNPDAGYHVLQEKIAVFNAKHEYVKQGVSVLPLLYGISFTYIPMNCMRATMTLDPASGLVYVEAFGVEMGQGLHTKMLQIAAYSLGIKPHFIRIDSVNATANDSKYPGTGASTGTDLNGRAIQMLADPAGELMRALQQNADLYSWFTKEDATKNKNCWFDKSGGGDRWPEAMAWFVAQQKLQFVAEYDMMNLLTSIDDSIKMGAPFYYFNYAAAMTHVQLDCLTGEWNILSTDIVYDAGVSINPTLDIGQIEGGFVQGTGFSTTEEIIYLKGTERGAPMAGELITTGTWTYKPPTTAETPQCFSVFLYPNDEADIALLPNAAQDWITQKVQTADRQLQQSSERDDAGADGVESKEDRSSLAKRQRLQGKATPHWHKCAHLINQRHRAVELVDSFGIQSAKTTGEPPLVLANTVFFALRDAVKHFRRARYGAKDAAAVKLTCPATTYALVDALTTPAITGVK